MKKIKIYNTIGLVVEVLTNGEPVSLVGRDIRVFITDSRGVSQEMEWRIDDERNNVIRFSYQGTQQTWSGVYRVEVWENKDGISQALFDKEAFELVPYSEMENDEEEGISYHQVELSGGALIVGGKDGVGIQDISFISHQDGYNTYKILLTDGREFFFNSNDGRQGDKGDQGYTPYIQDGYWYINGVSTGVQAEASIEITGLFINPDDGYVYAMTDDIIEWATDADIDEICV